MPNVQHSSLTDPNLHEPKGVAAASANRVYMSNGSGSGAWTLVNLFPGTGWGMYSNTTYVGGTSLAVSTSDVLLPFTTNVDVTQLPITLTGATSNLMDLGTETLLFVSAGDMHSITLNFKIASVVSNPAYIDLKLYGSSDGVTYADLLAETSVARLKASGQYVNVSSLFPVTANMVTYGARLFLRTDTGTANIEEIRLITARVHKAR